MPFTVQELENITNAALDYYIDRGKVFSSTIQSKPLLREMLANKKTFPSGKENLSIGVKGDYTTGIQGYTHDDTVGYKNPANIKRANFPWKEIHWGISCTMTELKKDGITITDSTDGTGESRHTDREVTAIANLLDDKLEDMKEGAERGLNSMFWADGTQDSKQIPGVKSFIVDNPATGTLIGGLDASVNTWWANRANLNIVVGSDPTQQVLVNFLQSELRQLRRYAQPQHIALCGSNFLTELEKELRAKGNYTLEGWEKGGAIDIGMADLKLKGIMFEYDPTLDDRGETNRLYMLDLKAIRPYFMDGEFMKKHSPARPEDKYVIYRAVTMTGGLTCRQRNSSGVYQFA
jgi:hypothetical protein